MLRLIISGAVAMAAILAVYGFKARRHNRWLRRFLSDKVIFKDKD